MRIKTRLMEPSGTIDYRKLYEQSQQDNARLRQEFASLREVNEQLLHRLDLLLRTHFGSKSERFLPKEETPGQLSLELPKEDTILVDLEGRPGKPSGTKAEKAKPGTPKKKRTDNI